MPGKWKVLLIDDHPVVRYGIERLLEGDERFELCGAAGDVASAKKLVDAKRPDLIVLDLMLGGRDGLELVRDLCALHPRGRILVFSAQPEMIYAHRAFLAGASGYLMKDEGLEKIPDALETLLRGERHASGPVQRAIFQKLAGVSSVSPPEVESLSDRELQVLRLMGAGFGTAQIAKELSLSMKTVGTYRERLKNKLGANDGRELERRASEFVRAGTL
jgi:two-component system invasion response regulator UvrY